MYYAGTNYFGNMMKNVKDKYYQSMKMATTKQWDWFFFNLLIVHAGSGAA